MNSAVDDGRVICPWAYCRNNARSGYAGNMSSDFIKRKCGHIFLRLFNFAVRYQTCFYKSLKSVADSKYKSVSLIQKVHNFFRNVFFAQNICNKFSRAVRFVSCAESACKRKNLCFFKLLFKFFQWICESFRCVVCKDENFCFCASKIKCASHIVFAVGTRKYGDKHGRFRICRRKYGRFSGFAQRFVDGFCKFRKRRLCFCSAYLREYVFQRGFPCTFRFFNRNICAENPFRFNRDFRFFLSFSDFYCCSAHKKFRIKFVRFNDYRTVKRCK